MPALTAANVTVVIDKRQRVGKEREHHVRITFGDGALTYPTAGVPLPALSAFGFSRFMRSLSFYGVNERTTDYKVDYGPAARTIMMYEEEAAAAGGPLLECDVAEAPPARTYSAIARGW